MFEIHSRYFYIKDKIGSPAWQYLNKPEEDTPKNKNGSRKKTYSNFVLVGIKLRTA